MGSGTSRGKKVAPACVSEVNVTKTTGGVTSPKQDSRPFKPLKIHAILRNTRNRAQPDCHSEGHDSDFSREDDDIDGEMDTVLSDYEERRRVSVKTNPPKKTIVRSKTYGLCYFSQEDEDFSSAPRSRGEEPRGSHGGSRDVNKMSNDAFTHNKKHTPACPSQHSSSSQGVLTRGALLEAAPTSEKQSTFGSCHSSSLTMPVTMYDGSEEELMDTIEKEFS
ncbi:uncharacterized protein LOC116670446 [Etheostoma spectabile]|uniref:Uncharacterized protein n=1 Tax=Etheostoma spectabile TaxID=54343 RepID=A0A5J5CJF6_9PERO|nr:uncharacterized protein LOC116670446 [Etheostoma spectabile]KAA8582078.1 hypothetical protein FQN60_008818 [Etheostoma spectabile]